ncbi:Golgi matrix protein 130 kD [Carabus blaptoides fortunei]
MADAVKAQKLAAARKRLKEYQKTQSKQKNVSNGDTETQKITEIVTPVESMTSSTHSCFDSNNYPENNQQDASFFNKALFQQSSTENNHILSNYFDTIPQETTPEKEILPTADVEYANGVENIPYADPLDGVEPKQNTIDSTNNSATVEQVNTLSPDGAADCEPTTHFAQMSHDDVTLPESQSECALPQPTTSNETPTNENQNLCSNTESLRQLSSQLNSLLDNSEAVAATNICASTTTAAASSNSELERRNQELAALLHTEQMKNEQLSLQVREYVSRIAQLDSETAHIRNEHEAKVSLQVGPLQEQLDYHVKACGILVGERTELQMALAQSQTVAKQKTSECEELHGRLKASRHRVGELEKEVNHLKWLKDNLDKYEQENTREFERLRMECKLLQEQYDEANEAASEFLEKLNVKVDECHRLQQDVQEKNSQLSLAQLKLQQLSNGESVQVESQIEILNQQKRALEHQISDLMATIKTVSAERDQASQQYQQYVQQLNAQIQSLAEKLEAKSSETDALAGREQSLVKHIGELEKHLQQLQNEKITAPGTRVDHSAEVKRLEEAVNVLQTEKDELTTRHDEEMDKKHARESELTEKCERIVELETQMERLKDQPDASKLLAAMESDKVAASRAVEQNKKLKQQLEELHEGFIKMSNSKLDLTEKLQSETHRANALNEQLTERATAVEHLHEVIATKDEQLTALHNQTTELQKQILHQNQLADRLRHYEAQGNSTDYVQQELQQAQHALGKLTTENQQLQREIEQLTGGREVSDKMATRDNSEIPTVTNELPLLQTPNETVDAKSEAMEKDDAQIDKEHAMAQLEARFNKTILDVANLTEEKQRLEHLVLQLQSETETIGEYVALYQCQRALMKEKTQEKDEQLQRLAQDREEMKHKLEQLNALIQRLVVEKGIITKEVLLSLHHDSCDNQVTNNTTAKSAVNDNNNVDGTAGKIIALLSEIKTSNLVQPGESIQNFHPCPLCSGQLITV